MRFVAHMAAHREMKFQTEERLVFHAATRLEDSQILSNGGRVLCATSLGTDLKDAQKKAYDLINEIEWSDSYFRTDIGFKGLKYV